MTRSLKALAVVGVSQLSTRGKIKAYSKDEGFR